MTESDSESDAVSTDVAVPSSTDNSVESSDSGTIIDTGLPVDTTSESFPESPTEAVDTSSNGDSVAAIPTEDSSTTPNQPVTITAEGDIATFDSETFVDDLAASLGVDPSEIEVVQVTAASVNVETLMSLDAQTALEEATPEQLSEAGVTGYQVEGEEPVEVSPTAVPSPSPSPSPTPIPADDSSTNVGLIVGVIVGILVLLLCCACCIGLLWWYYSKKNNKKKKIAMGRPHAQQMQQGSIPDNITGRDALYNTGYLRK
eukprot:CFRG4160T1